MARVQRPSPAASTVVASHVSWALYGVNSTASKLPLAWASATFMLGVVLGVPAATSQGLEHSVCYMWRVCRTAAGVFVTVAAAKLAAFRALFHGSDGKMFPTAFCKRRLDCAARLQEEFAGSTAVPEAG